MIASIPMALREMAEWGLHIFPCHTIKDGKCDCDDGEKCSSPGKHPWLKNWQALATTDLEQIARWLIRYAGCNFGIATGLKSGVGVLDIDPRNGGDETLAAHEATHGPLPSTWECLTGGGGRHLFFRLPGDGTVKSKNDALGRGLDFKANGGFVIAAGSIHASGRRYDWSVDGHPDYEQLADCPQWIVEALERHTPVTAGDGSNNVRPKVSADQWRARAESEIYPGSRTQRVTEFAGLMLRKGIEPHVILTLLLGWNARSCKPPLPEAKVMQTIAGIMAHEAKKREKRNAA